MNYRCNREQENLEDVQECHSSVIIVEEAHYWDVWRY